jgi:hypothetical protein
MEDVGAIVATLARPALARRADASRRSGCGSERRQGEPDDLRLVVRSGLLEDALRFAQPWRFGGACKQYARTKPHYYP